MAGARRLWPFITEETIFCTRPGGLRRAADSESPTGESTPVHGLNSLLGISWAAERNGDGRRVDLLSQGAGRQGPGQGVGTQKRKGGAGGRGRGIRGVCGRGCPQAGPARLACRL